MHSLPCARQRSSRSRQRCLGATSPKTSLVAVTLRALRAASVLLCLFCASACAEDTSTDVAGTGSSGGNPATEDPVTLTFQLNPEPLAEPERIDWLDAELAPFTIALGRGTEEGECSFSPDDLIENVDLIGFDRSALASVDARNLCAIRILPGQDAPLLRIVGQTQRFDIDLSFWLDAGVELTLDFVQRWAEGSRDWVLVLDPEPLTADVDLVALVRDDGQIVLSDRDPRFTRALRQRLAQSVRLYVDPTPGDGTVSEDEQTTSNSIGGLRLLP